MFKTPLQADGINQPGMNPGFQPGSDGTKPARPKAAEPEDLIVEILSIEIFNPGRESAGTASRTRP